MAFGYNVHANGIRQHLIHYPGKGPAMLLIPGITSPAITWGFVAERLTEKFDVHVLDVRGRGLSQAGELDYSLDAMARDAIEVSKAAGLGKDMIDALLSAEDAGFFEHPGVDPVGGAAVA